MYTDTRQRKRPHLGRVARKQGGGGGGRTTVLRQIRVCKYLYTDLLLGEPNNLHGG